MNKKIEHHNSVFEKTLRFLDGLPQPCPSIAATIKLLGLKFFIGIVIGACLVLLMIYYFPSHFFISRSLENKLTEGDGTFQWSWAGENWVGDMIFTKNSQGDIEAELIVYKIKKQLRKNGQEEFIKGPCVIKSIHGSKGHVKVSKDRITIKKMLVKKSQFKPGTFDEIIGESVEHIEIDLSPVIAFAGKINYKPGQVDYIGDIVLIKHRWSP